MKSARRTSSWSTKGAGSERHGQALRDELGPVLAELDTDEAVRRLMAHGVPVGRVNNRTEVLCDPQVVHNASLCEVANGDVGRVRLPAGAARFGQGARQLPGPAAHRGQHSREILADLGYDAVA